MWPWHTCLNTDMPEIRSMLGAETLPIKHHLPRSAPKKKLPISIHQQTPPTAHISPELQPTFTHPYKTTKGHNKKRTSNLLLKQYLHLQPGNPKHKHGTLYRPMRTPPLVHTKSVTKADNCSTRRPTHPPRASKKVLRPGLRIFGK